MIRPTNLFLRLEDLSTPVPDWAKNVILAVNRTLTNHSVERIHVQPSSTELELHCNNLKTLLFSRAVVEGTVTITTPKLETLSLPCVASVNVYPKSLTSLSLFSITVEACSKLDLPCLSTLQIERLNRVADTKVFKAEEVFPSPIHALILSEWCVRLDFSNSHKIRTLTWIDHQIIDPLPPSLTKLSAGVTKTEVYITPLKELAVLEYRPMVKRFYWPPNIVSITIGCVGEYRWPAVMPHRLKYSSLRGWCAPTLEELPEWTKRVRVVRNP